MLRALRSSSAANLALRPAMRPALRPTVRQAFHPQAALLQSFRQQSARQFSFRSVPGKVSRGLLKLSVIALAIPVGYLAGFFIYDASTYRNGPLQIDVDVSPDALNLKTGGPKNLPIADVCIDDNELGHNDDKPRIVILGSGWGSVALIRSLDTTKYNVTLISPTNHFLFTPLLPSAAVGTLSLDTLVEPIRDLCRKKNVRFIEGAAHDIDFKDRLVEVRAQAKGEEEVFFYVPYDKVVFGMGAKTNTHGVPGLKNCFFFKEARDAENLRMAIARNLEIASLPSTTDEERKKLLSFVICGGGPTGVELASEIFDLLKEDMPKKFPHLLVNQASVHIIQSRPQVLNTYDEQISQYAMKRFMQDGIDLQTNSRVVEVLPDAVIFTRKEGGETKQYELPYGICLWTTGVSLTRFTKTVMDKLPGAQRNKRALETDAYCRVLGTPPGEVYAIGDCATVRTSLVDDLKVLLAKKTADQKGVTVDTAWMPVGEIEKDLTDMANNEPQARNLLLGLRDKVHRRHKPGEMLSAKYLAELLTDIDSKIVSLPATAQRANQQGIYLAKKFNKIARAQLKASGPIVEEKVYKPFSYQNLGSLAYLSNAAVFDTNDSVGFNIFGGIAAMYLWRGVYLSQTVSMRARLHMVFDWLYRGLFGRQIYSYDRTK